jgi:hypothetical protein
MKRRYVFAAAVVLVAIALVVGMFPFSLHMVRQERDWREQGVGIGPSAQIGVDISMWWLKYWWTAAPMVIGGAIGIAAVIVFTGRSTPLSRVQA